MTKGPFQKQPSTEKAPNKKDKGLGQKPNSKHPLAPMPSKDPKKKGIMPDGMGSF